MPFNQSKTAIVGHKLRMKSKYKSIVEETKSVTEFLQKRLALLNHRLKELEGNNGENFFTFYEKLNKDFDQHQEKIFLVLASLDDSDDSTSESNESATPSEGSKTPSDITEKNDCVEAITSNLISESPEENLICVSPSLPSSSCQSLNKALLDAACMRDSPTPSLTSHHVSTENKQISSLISENYMQISSQIDKTTQQCFSNLQPSENSLSRSSLYRSMCSNFSDARAPSELSNASDTTAPSPDFETVMDLLIPPPCISVPSDMPATLAYVINPDNFWMRLQNTDRDVLNFPVTRYVKKCPPAYIKEGCFYLSLFKSHSYYRALALNSASGDMEVTVFLIDYGSSQTVAKKDLRSLPRVAYELPRQAIHCYLIEVVPIGKEWSPQAIKSFKEFKNNTLNMLIKAKNDDKYGVKLISIVDIPFLKGFYSPVSEVLTAEGYCESNKVHEVTEVHDPFQTGLNQASCDSGVSVTSFVQSASLIQKLDISTSLSLEHLTKSNEPLNIQKVSEMTQSKDVYYSESLQDVISSQSNDEVGDILMKSTKGSSNLIGRSECTNSPECLCELHLRAPPAILKCVEEDMMIVMLSNIVDPWEFYVNIATEDSFALDDLRDRMSNFYETRCESNLLVFRDDLCPGMYCAGWFPQDKFWYRVKILMVISEPTSENEVFVQSIDYGNKAQMKCSDLRLLLPEYVRNPAFSIKFSLAGIKPPKSESVNTWSIDAVKKFQEMGSFQRLLTAQLCKEYGNSEKDICHVWLWDTCEKDDFLINNALVESGFAEFDDTALRLMEEKKPKENSFEDDSLNSWDPMATDFNDIENSYGVHNDDFQVAISGYKPNDDSYICKYYSVTGKCPRKFCRYMHVDLGAGGVTRDQGEDYACDNVPPLPEASDYVMLRVTAIINPGHFYAVMPYGDKNIDDTNALIQQGCTNFINNEVSALFAALSTHYMIAPFAENTTLALACGNIVVAWQKLNQAWHRGRIVDVVGIAEAAKVYFVDFGNQEWVERKLIRTILPQFLHTPFQAVECHLSNVEPIGFEVGMLWSPSATKRFVEIVKGEVLVGKITFRFGNVLHLTLRKTSMEEHTSVGKQLVLEGFAQQVTFVKCEKESKHVPG